VVKNKASWRGKIFWALFLLELISFGSFPGWGKTITQKIAGEIIFQRKGFIFRFRPVDYTWPSSLWKYDLLIGHRFGRFVGYGYFKAEGIHRRWLGLRLGLNTKIMANRVRAIAQIRLFYGLNSSSPHHYYLIPALFYLCGPQKDIEVGFLGYEKQLQGHLATFIFGPAVILPLLPHIKSRFYWGSNLFGEGQLIYIKFYFYL
jgi:hypothetical protein